MLHISRLLVFIFFAVSICSPAASAASSKKSPYTLFELSCKKNQRATGCAAPFRQCDLGVDTNIADTCKISAKNQRCPDFSWEKCCAANCYLRAGNTMKGTEACMDQCGDSIGSRIYWPKAIKTSSKR